jgi:hypothetical protein
MARSGHPVHRSECPWSRDRSALLSATQHEKPSDAPGPNLEAIFRPRRELTGELFGVDVDGELRITRMKHRYGEGCYSIDGYPLRDGMRAVIGRG